MGSEMEIVLGLMELEGLSPLSSDPATMRLIDAFHGFEATPDQWDALRARRTAQREIGGDWDHDGVLSPSEMELLVWTETDFAWSCRELEPEGAGL